MAIFLQIKLTQLTFLPTHGDTPSKQELLVARKLLACALCTTLIFMRFFCVNAVPGNADNYIIDFR